VETRSLYEGSYRKDHTNFGEVYETTYEVGKVTAFGQEKTDPLTLDETMTVEIGEAEHSGIPIFYHCKKGWYSEDSGALLENGALRHGSLAFTNDKQVKVMFQRAAPVAVIGYADNKPRHCLNIIKMQITDYGGNKHTYHYRVTDQSLYAGRNVAALDQNGEEIQCSRKGMIVAGQREIQFGTVIYYLGDHLVVLGPFMWMIQIYAIGLPLPLTGQLWVSMAPYSKDLYDSTIALGAEKESQFPSAIFMPLPTQRYYPGFTVQTAFSKVLTGLFGQYLAPQPRWIYTKLWAQDWDY
jgi:hypothetical protein